MNSGSRVRAALVILAVSCAACGRDANSPITAAPTLPSPFVAQVAGEWAGAATLRQPVGGTFTDLGECIQQDLNARPANTIAAAPMVLSMGQKDADVEARLTSSSTGLACSYTGRATVGTVALYSVLKLCDAPVLVVRCSLDRVRDMKLVGSSVTGTIDAQRGTFTGAVANTYNVFLSGSETGVAGVVLTYDYTARKQ